MPRCLRQQLRRAALRATPIIAGRRRLPHYCEVCDEDYELKAQKGRFGRKVNDGAFSAMCERLAASRNPTLVLMNYDLARRGVTDLFLVPKHFFVRAVIEERKPLAATARRAGWVGCNILLGDIPDSGKIWFVRSGEVAPKAQVLEQWRSTLFLRDQGTHWRQRGWLIEVMKCVEMIVLVTFSSMKVYGCLRRWTWWPVAVRVAVEDQHAACATEGFLTLFVGRRTLLKPIAASLT